MYATRHQAAALLEALAARLRDALSVSPELARDPSAAIATVVEAILEGPRAEHEGDDVAFLKSLGAPRELVTSSTATTR